MIETILASLIIAAVSGLTFLAYKHPKGYTKIGTVTNYFVSIGFFIYMIWYLGYQQGFYDGNKTEDKFAHPVFSIEPFPWLILIVFIVQAYLFFLKNLPKILEIESKETAEDDNK